MQQMLIVLLVIALALIHAEDPSLSDTWHRSDLAHGQSLNLADNQPIINTDIAIKAMAVNTIENSLYLIESGGNRLVQVDGSSLQLIRVVDVGVQADAIAVEPVRGEIYILGHSESRSNLYIVNESTLTIIKTFSLSFLATELLLDNYRHVLYAVGNYARAPESDSVSIARMEYGSGSITYIQDIVESPARVSQAQLDVCRNLMLLMTKRKYPSDDMVRVVDLATRRQVSVLQVQQVLGGLPGFGVDQLSGRIYISMFPKSLAIIGDYVHQDGVPDEAVTYFREIPAGRVYLGSDGHVVYIVSGRPYDVLTVVKSDDGQVMGSVPLGSGNHPVTVDRYGARLFVAVHGGRQIMVHPLSPPPADISSSQCLEGPTAWEGAVSKARPVGNWRQMVAL